MGVGRPGMTRAAVCFGLLASASAGPIGCAPNEDHDIGAVAPAAVMTDNGLPAVNGLAAANGLGSINGLRGVDGFNANNGFNAANGFNGANGIGSVNGLNLAN